MEILKKGLIEHYKKRHADSIKPLNNWEKLVSLAKWKKPQDIKNAIRSVDFLSGNRVLFNIGGNKHRLLVIVVYARERMIIEWIGTHAEYDKKKF